MQFVSLPSALLHIIMSAFHWRAFGRTLIKLIAFTMSKKIQVALCCLLYCCLFSCSASGQTIKYSNKAFNITLDYPLNWHLLTEQEINALRNQPVTATENQDSSAATDSNDITIISIALNKRTDPDYTLQVLSDHIIEASKDKSEYDYLINGIEYMKQQGIRVIRYTLPMQFSTSKGIPFCTSTLEVMVGGLAHYERNFVIKRPNDFLIISATYLDINDGDWMEDVVNSVSFN